MKKMPLSEPLVFQVFHVKHSKTEDKKIKIMEAVIDLLASEGFDNTTFEAIGKRVKMQRTHVNYYFSSRLELVKTAIRYAVALGQQITIGHVQKAKNWREQLTAVVEGPFEWVTQYPKHTAVMALFYQLCSYDGEFRAIQNVIRSGGEERLAACFQVPIEAGHLTVKQARELARTIQALMTGQLVNYYSSDYPIPLAALKANTVKVAFDLLEMQMAKKG